MIKRKRNIYKIMSVMLCAALLTGCGNGKVEYGTETPMSESVSEETTVEEAASEEPVKELTGALAKELGAESTWEKDIVWQKDSGATGVVNVNAKVDVPDTDGMQVAKISARWFDETEKKKIAESLFDEGSIVPIGNCGYATKEELMDAIKENQEDMERWKSDGETGIVNQYESQIKLLQDTYNNFADIEKDDFTVSKFKGTKNGQPYTLDFEDIGYEGGTNEDGEDYYRENKFPYICFKPDSNATFYDKQYLYYGLADDVCDFGENQASMTENQAEEMVRRFLEDAGITGMDIYESHNLNWAEDSDNGDFGPVYSPVVCDGYAFILYRKIQDCFVTDRFITPGFDMAGVEGGYYKIEAMTVYVTDEGILEVEYSYPIKVDEVVTEHAELLSFDSVKEVFENHIADPLGYLNGATKFLENMELTYIYNGYSYKGADDGEDGYCYLIPVWNLYRTAPYDRSYYDRMPPAIAEGVTVNAIDGSLIQ